MRLERGYRKTGRAATGRRVELQGISISDVEGGRIKSVAGGSPAAPEGARTIDCGGRVVMPGLIDAHWHSVFAALPVSSLFAADVGYIFLAASAEAEQPGEQVVFRVTDIVVPKTDLNSNEAKTIAQMLNRSLSEDIFSQYIAQVENEIGVTINRNAVSQVVSGKSINTSNNISYDTDF